MSPWHLLWIIPLAASFGFSLCGCLMVAGDYDEDEGEEGEDEVC